jgi:hypothetical protein
LASLRVEAGEVTVFGMREMLAGKSPRQEMEGIFGT